MASNQPQQHSESIERRVAELVPKIQAGDQKSLREGLLLLPMTDGALGEDLTIALGRTIRPYAARFLEALAAGGPIARLDALVGSLGGEFVDKFGLQLIELEARKQALLKVRDPKLQRARALCLSALDEQIKVLQRLESRR